ncbi:Fatty acid amide hydrolase 1 [Colletotrichum sojae]|uniref:Fatty acid amide hydrolase 1 n=1 Tax=Colletotrichum sojae TaxID=2175907 RepID=A0A8H6JDE1_9PEZI|nr:Fatty acid amide hydrolase 1 [Colletotrichum sojae]
MPCSTTQSGVEPESKPQRSDPEAGAGANTSPSNSVRRRDPNMSSEARKKFINYPVPHAGPPIPYENGRGSNPPLRGWLLVIAACLMEWVWFLRAFIWSNAGFGSVRRIRKHIEDVEPRYDPTVLPFPLAEAKDPAVLHRESAVRSKPRPFKYYSVNDYHEMYLSGEITPLAVAHAILPLIRRDTNPPGEHSIAWFDTKVTQVLAAAEASTRRYKEGKPLGVLDGVPTAVKDEYEMDGYRTCLGSRNDYTTLAEPGKSINSWCVTKLQDAGAVILGKLSMHEFGLDTTGNNPIYGTPRNPYNRGYYTGGSSSGAGYAVAAGLVPVALGSDGGGSIRIPSSLCGVYGLKPTHGRVSFHPCPNHSNSCAVNGPIAADVESLAACFEVVGTPHPNSNFIQASPFVLSPSEKRGKMLGVPESWFARADPAIQRMCRTMIARLVTHHGYVPVPIEIPFLVEGQSAHAMTVLTDAATLLPETSNLTHGNRILLAIGRVTPATDYLLAQKLRGLLMQHLAHLWRLHPGMIIVTPTTACAGWPIASESELGYGVSDGDRTIRSMEYVWLGNFCGLPGVTVPAGYVVPHDQPGAGGEAGPDTVGKVPVGLMGVGEWTDEHGLLEFGLDAEELFAKERCRPPGWVDVIQRARDEMAKSGEAALIDI